MNYWQKNNNKENSDLKEIKCFRYSFKQNEYINKR